MIKIILTSGVVIEIHDTAQSVSLDDLTKLSSAGIDIVQPSQVDNAGMAGSRIGEGCDLSFLHPDTGLPCSMSEYNGIMLQKRALAMREERLQRDYARNHIPD